MRREQICHFDTAAESKKKEQTQFLHYLLLVEFTRFPNIFTMDMDGKIRKFQDYIFWASYVLQFSIVNAITFMTFVFD